MYNNVKTFEELTCWKKARELKKELYQLARDLPRYEQYELSSQIRGASVSVTANIVEGYGRFGYQEKIQFARYSRASVYELKDHLYSCLDAGYITQQRFEILFDKCKDVGISINGYIGYLQREKQNK